MDAKEVGNKIAAIRKEKGWTQKEIAERLYVSTAAVSKWERGLNYPDLSLMEPLAELLEISVAELLGVVNQSEESIIKNITEISREEKARVTLNIRKKVACIIGTMAIFFAVILVVLVIGSNKGNYVAGFVWFEVIPLILGFGSWGLAFAGILLGRGKLKEKWIVYSVFSLVLCAIALYSPILDVDNHIRRGALDSVVDIVWGLNYGSIVLLIGTLLFNGLSWCLNREK